MRGLEKFYKFAKEDPITGCWFWMGGLFKTGYGKVNFEGKTSYAHRVSYEVFFKHPGKLDVCHKCDNRQCVNPTHLFLGTRKQNMQDAKTKGRTARNNGPRNGRSILTDKITQEISNRFKQGESAIKLGKEFKVSRSTIYYICKRGWLHLKEGKNGI